MRPDLTGHGHYLHPNWQKELENKTPLQYFFLHIFSGIVTNDQLVDCGLFVLDNKVIVCQSTLCVITNIRKVKLGMKVAINNVHTIKLKSLGKIGMILCARGRLDILEDQGNPSH